MRLRTSMVAALAIATLGTAAQAQTTVLNTELGVLPSPGSTVTDATGTRSTNSADGSANRVSEVFAANEWQQRNVGGDGVVGITTDYARSGNGSLFLSTVDSGSKADMEFYFSSPLSLSSFVSASYDWYRAGTSTNNAIQVPSLRLALQGQGGFSYLIFEPYYQGAWATAPVDSWQTSTIGMSSTVWSNNSNLNLPGGTTSCAIGCFTTLGSWVDANPNAVVLGFSTGVGSGWNGAFTGAVDNIAFSFDGSGESFNFEVAAIPEPGTWATMILGFALIGGTMRVARRRAALA